MRQVSSREVYRNPWMRVREDVTELPDGTRGLYGVVEKPDFAVVVPREADGSLWLVSQHRYTIDRRSWEFPQGAWPPGSAGGEPVALAQAELREETGFTAGSWTHLGWLASAYGYATQGFDVWLAEDLVPGPHDREPTEGDMEARRVTVAELEDLVRSGALVDGDTLAALTLLRLHDGR